ncbi:hypothetical protein PVAP13_9KG171213, partial [Panicum virgatum]
MTGCAARCSVKAAKKLSKKGGLASELNTIAHHKAASFAAGSSLYKENSGNVVWRETGRTTGGVFRRLGRSRTRLHSPQLLHPSSESGKKT